MIKRTLYFGNPAYLSLQNAQLVLRLPEVEKNEGLTETFKKQVTTSVAIEDIAIVILDHTQITITQALMSALLENNVALITCSATHLPNGLLLNLSGNTLQSERFRYQIDASIPLKKQLWQQTIEAKVHNQGVLLNTVGAQGDYLVHIATQVKSGDADNAEATAAAYYWKNIFADYVEDFKRHREGDSPNTLLNYGYAILRAIVARNLVGSGLLPTLGIHHRNKYNAYCLADDVMEPYRPFVDAIVWNIVKSGLAHDVSDKLIKQNLLSIATADVIIDGEKSPLMVAVQRTTASLVKCFMGEQRKVLYPTWAM